MTPTQYGRWQTRLLLLGSVGVLLTALFALAFNDWVTPYVLLGYVAAIGLLKDVIYIGGQRGRWHQDWPLIFHLIEGMIEGAFIWALVQRLGLPRADPSLTLMQFVAYYGAVWTVTFLFMRLRMGVALPVWRFGGGKRAVARLKGRSPEAQLVATIPTLGRYQLKRDLGKRGHVTVYLAMDPKLERDVAIKLLAKGSATDFYRRFQEENEILAALNHPAIVAVYDVGMYEERPYVVMPFLAGGTLASQLQRGALPLEMIGRVMAHISDALTQAHERGVVHGQLNPQNVLFDEAERAYISDFGIRATTLATLTPYQARYIAPEAVMAYEVGKRFEPTVSSDVYSLGIVLYEALVGAPPFVGEEDKMAEVLTAHLQAPVPPVAPIRESLPQGIEAVLARALAKSPLERYATVQMLATELAEVLAGRWYITQLGQRLGQSVEVVEAGVEVDTAVVEGPKIGGEAFGRYRVISMLGKGSMGKVYLAHDPHTNRHVAVKLLASHLMRIPHFRQRLQREAELVAQLRHEAIVTVYDIGEVNGYPFLVMPYLAGGTLIERLAQGPLALGQLADILTRIASALDVAHHHNIIHLDVKPGNILFDDAGQAYLSDFGAAILREGDKQNRPAGTPLYMSPEQARALLQQEELMLEPGNDVYALGVIAFEALTGHPPFWGNGLQAVLLAHAEAPIPLIGEVRAGLPAPTQEIMDKALSKSLAERYQSAGAFAEAFQELATGAWLYRRLSKKLDRDG